MNRVGAGIQGDPQHLVHIEVGLNGVESGAQQVSLVSFEAVQGKAILVGVDGHGANAELTRRTQYPDGNLAAIRDQQLAEQSVTTHFALRRAHGDALQKLPHRLPALKGTVPQSRPARPPTRIGGAPELSAQLGRQPSPAIERGFHRRRWQQPGAEIRGSSPGADSERGSSRACSSSKRAHNAMMPKCISDLVTIS